MGKDKLLHIVVSAVIMVVLGMLLPTWVAVVATLNDGWKEKDAVDWSAYESLLAE